jgi:hypothetical protein
MFSEADRLDMLKALGAETFDTGHASPLWGVLEGEYNEPALTGISIEGEVRWIEARQSDVDAHGLIKGSRLTRIGTGDDLFVRRLEPNRSSGFVQVWLTS